MNLTGEIRERIQLNRLAALERKRLREDSSSQSSVWISLREEDRAVRHRGCDSSARQLKSDGLIDSRNSEERNSKRDASGDDCYEVDASSRRCVPAQRLINSSERQSDSAQLSDEQERVRSEVLLGKSCFLTGCGGTGKSFLTARLIADLKDKYGTTAVAVTATTGIAACHIRGVSLHSFAGIGLGQGTVIELISKVRKNRQAMERWKSIKCLIIDEISMLDCALFDKLDEIARTVRGNSKPFGGIQLLLVGDFAQLPPVSKGGGVEFCFESRVWGEAIQLQVELKKVFRQSNMEFVNILSSIRLGICTPEIAERLNSTRNNILNETNGVRATRLFSKNMDVEVLNMNKVSELPGDVVTLVAYDHGESPYQEALEKNCLAPHKLLLKPGAQVMLLKNLQTELGLTNGACGVFMEVVAPPADRAPGGGESELLVRFETPHGVMDHVVRRETFSTEVAGKVVASRSQYPLKLAYAITIHKCQGMTLSKAELSLGGVFEYGQAYVALSRVSDLAGLRLLDFTPALVKCHPRVLQFYGTLTSSLPPAPPAHPHASLLVPPSPPPFGRSTQALPQPLRDGLAGRRGSAGAEDDVVITKVTHVQDAVAYIDLDSDDDCGAPALADGRHVTKGDATRGCKEAGDVAVEVIRGDGVLAPHSPLSESSSAQPSPLSGSSSACTLPSLQRSQGSPHGGCAIRTDRAAADGCIVLCDGDEPVGHQGSHRCSAFAPDRGLARQEALGTREEVGCNEGQGAGSGAGEDGEDGDDGELVCFTDGACRGNSGPAAVAGYAVVWPGAADMDCAGRLGDSEAHTNNRAEYRAAIRAMEQADGVDPGRTRPLRIYTGSKLLIDTVLDAGLGPPRLAAAGGGRGQP